MPFVKLDIDKEIAKQCAADPEFKKIFEENEAEYRIIGELIRERKRAGLTQEELMAEFPDNPLLKNFSLNKEETERLFKAMEEPARVVGYEKNNRLQTGKELLEKLSREFGRSKKC